MVIFILGWTLPLSIILEDCLKTSPTGSCGSHPFEIMCPVRWFAINTLYLFSCCFLGSVLYLPSLHQIRPDVPSVAIMDFIIVWMFFLKIYSEPTSVSYGFGAFCCPFTYLKRRNAPVNVLLCFTKKKN